MHIFNRKLEDTELIQAPISLVANVLRKCGIVPFASALLLISCTDAQPTVQEYGQSAAGFTTTAQAAAVYDDTEQDTGNQSVEYRFNDYDNIPADVSALFRPMQENDQDPFVLYMKDVDRAFFHLKNKQFDKADALFTQIGKETLFEIPNDATWAGHAAALCQMGKKPQGQQKLSNAKCTIALISNSMTCTDLDAKKAEADFPKECYREMCEAEIIRSDYDGGAGLPPVTGVYAGRIASYQSYVDNVGKICR